MPRTATEWFRMDWQGGAKAKQSQRRIGKAKKHKDKQWNCIEQRRHRLAWLSPAWQGHSKELKSIAKA